VPLDPLPAGLDDHLLGGDFDGNTSPRVDRGPGGNVDGSVNSGSAPSLVAGAADRSTP
jgi:hypothetical protein